MSAKKFITMLGFGFVILGLNYYLYVLWYYFFVNNTCLSNTVKDVNINIVCWGVNPTAFIVVFIVSIGMTIGYMYQIYRTIRYGW